MIRFYSNIGCSEYKVIFKWRKKKQQQQHQQQQIKLRLYKEPTFAPRVFHSVSELSQNVTNKRSQQTEKPALSLR